MILPILRPEQSFDLAQVRLVNEVAFGRADEADLVDALRFEGAVLGSFVAEIDGEIVGHILFSRMSIDSSEGVVPAASLAPVAVLPGYRRRGIANGLIRHGLEELQRRGERIVIVLGHPEYYSRFGFSTDNARLLLSPFPPEAFMALELEPGSLRGVFGRVRYPQAFCV